MTFTKDIERLCHQVSEEKDGDKLLALVDQLNEQLEGLSKVSPEVDTAEQTSGASQRPEGNPKAA